MPLAARRRRTRIPLSLKIAYTLFVLVLVPSYWRAYGPANFLSFCDVGLLVTSVGLWLESPLLFSISAVALTLPQTVWVCDFLSGGRILGITGYMFNSALPGLTRLLSTFHIWLPILLIVLVWKLGYDRRAGWLQSVILTALLILSYVLTDPRNPPSGYPAAAVNLNRVYGLKDTAVQTALPPLVYLATELLFFVVCVYLPTHLFFRRVFRQPVTSTTVQPPVPAPQPTI